MMKKGQITWRTILTLFIVAAITVIVLKSVVIPTRDTGKGLVASFKDTLLGVTNKENQPGETWPCPQAYRDDTQDENQQKLQTLTEEFNSDLPPTRQLPWPLVRDLAQQESNMRHCNSEGNVVSSGLSYGIMQINPDTAESICPDADLKNKTQNIKCGLAILKDKHEQATSWSESEYHSKINSHCDADNYKQIDNYDYTDYRQHYKQYEGWNRALRAYNGLGCGENADICYVEHVQGQNCEFES